MGSRDTTPAPDGTIWFCGQRNGTLGRLDPRDGSYRLVDLGKGFWRVTARVGFMQEPRVPRILAACGARGLPWGDPDVTYYMGRQTLLIGGKSRMARWRALDSILWPVKSVT